MKRQDKENQDMTIQGFTCKLIKGGVGGIERNARKGKETEDKTR
jgi:hypothetical protein